MGYFKRIYYLFLLIVLSSCFKKSTTLTHSAYKPVLIETDNIRSEVKWLSPKENKLITQLKKEGNYLYALDYGLGIHVIDVTDVNNPLKKGFYQIPACIDFEVRNNLVYANNYRDFIIIDFTNIDHPAIVKRETGTFDLVIKAPDGLSILDELKQIPANTTIISYEKL